MKKFLPLTIWMFAISFLGTSLKLHSQSFPEMVFENPVKESGTFGADGSKYRFSNVATDLDAVVEIRGRSAVGVELSSIDTVGTGLGYDMAFQPVLGIPGVAPANTTWWMDFRIYFYIHGTSIPTVATQFYVTGLDIDGDGASVNEWAEMKKVEKVDTTLINSLTCVKQSSYFQGYDYRIDGIIANSPGIDTSAHNVMATYKYALKSQIDFRIGANTAGSSSNAAMRLNSLWFKQMYLGIPLPLNLTSFTAVLNENNKVDLHWSTAAEVNFSRFVVEKSTDGKNFNTAGFVYAAGTATSNSNYMFSDNQDADPQPVMYYRLRCEDADGGSKYSETRIIHFSKQSTGQVRILSYPNPATSSLHITLPDGWQNKQVLYEIFNSVGQPVSKLASNTSSQTETLNINTLGRGIYMVKVTCEGQVAQQKIIKN